MSHIPYPYKQIDTKQFIFYSVGTQRIEKVVEFTPVGPNNIVNLAFGDLRPNGTIDDQANSNNGDIAKVLATVIEILKHYSLRYPSTVIHFTGSTQERTRLYCRIIKTYYSQFSKEFTVHAIIEGPERTKIVLYDPDNSEEISAFLIKRII